MIRNHAEGGDGMSASNLTAIRQVAVEIFQSGPEEQT